ncbi:GyrI-like domain-containing protein [Mycoplasmatota bacterium WC44]
MKVDFKKKYSFYKCKQVPTLVSIPKMKYISISGEGNPNTSYDFKKSVEALFKFSYTLKMLPKKGTTPNGYFEYVVAPLEGIWNTKDETEFVGNKDDLVFKLIIHQPKFLTEELFNQLKYNIICDKKSSDIQDYIEKLSLEEIDEGQCIQILHIGPYDNEPETLESVFDYLRENKIEYIRSSHHEIYLSDARRTEPRKLKTIIRYKLK